MEGIPSKKAKKTNERSGTPTVVDVSHANSVYNIHGGTVINQQQSSHSSTLQTELEARKRHDALQRCRNALKDYNIRECKIPVTEDYNDLTEPPNEVYSKLLRLLKFYEGDLLKMMSQYQKDLAFKYGHEATSHGEELDYATFLHLVIEMETKTICVTGQAGSGKSTMLRRVVRDLTERDENLLIFFMNFRDFIDSEKISPCDFLFRGSISESDKTTCFEWILANQDKAMLVLDGLDQANWTVEEDAKVVGPYGEGRVSEIVSSIFKGKLFPDVKVVYSSREHAIASLEGKLRPKIVVALTGLSPADSEWLFKTFVGENGEMLWEKLRVQSRPLIPLLSIPAFVTFTAIVYMEQPDKPPRSMTEVLKNLLELFMRSGHIMEKDVPKVLAGLKKMCFIGMKDGKVIFYIDNVRNAGLDPEKIRDWAIKIPGLNKRNQFLLEGQYVLIFSHQIIQEFLAAQYIVEMKFEFFENSVKQYLMSSEWSVVTRFVSGLLLNDEFSADLSTVTDVELKRNTFKSTLRNNYLDGTRLSQLESLTALSESNQTVFIRDLVHDIYLELMTLGDSDAYVIGSVMYHLIHLHTLRLYRCHLRPETLCVLWDSIKHGNLKITRLDLRRNPLGPEAFTMIGEFVRKCSVNELTLPEVTNEGVKNLLSACEGAAISMLHFYLDKMDHLGYTTLGKIVKACTVDKLRIKGVNLCHGNLKNFLSEANGAKISEIGIFNCTPEDTGCATLGQIVKTCAVDNLTLRACRLNEGNLKNLLSGSDGAKISKLNISCDALSDTGYATLGTVVKIWGVDELVLRDSNLSDGKLKYLLSKTQEVKVSSLDVSGNHLDECTAVILGDIVKRWSVQKLKMRQCGLDNGLLNDLLSRARGAKISKLNISGNKLGDTAYATLGTFVKIWGVDELVLANCDLSDGKLKYLLSETQEVKVSSLDVSYNHLDKDKASILGDIVKRWSVEKLTMQWCGLDHGSLNTLLSRANGAKLIFIDVSNDKRVFILRRRHNNLSKALLNEVCRSIAVKRD